MIEWIVTSSILIAIIATLRYLLKGKISLRLQYALWGLVLLRLLIPFSIGSSRFSVMNTAKAISVVRDFESVRDVGDIWHTSSGSVEGYPSYELMPETPVTVAENKTEAEFIRMEKVLAFREAFIRIWLCGAAILFITFAASNGRFSSRLRRTRKPLEVKGSALPVYISNETDTPCLFGLFQPAIYVTSKAAEDAIILRHTVEHETTHFRHGDNFWSILRVVCLALHWYNPLVWRAAFLSRNDAELACDEATIRRIGEADRAEYGRTLIGMTCQKRAALLITATTITGSKGSIKERITLIAKKPKLFIPAVIAVVLVAFIAVGCTFTGAKTGGNAGDDAYFNVSGKDPAETVKSYLEAEKEQAYTISLEIHEVAVSESDTVKVIENFKGSDYAESKGWTDEYVENNIVAVAAYYSVKYDHDKIFYDDGDFVRIFYLEYDDKHGFWTIWDNDGGAELGAFLNGNMEWPDCLTKPEGTALGSVADGVDVPDTVLETAKKQAAKYFEAGCADFPDYEYANWRVESLKWVYTYDDLDGLTLKIYRMNYEFLSEAPENVTPAGGMYITNDNWVCPTYPNCTYLVFNADDSFFFGAVMENDCEPGDERFTSDLSSMRLSELALKATGVENVIASVDIDKDGKNEHFYLDKTQMDSGPWVTLRIYNDSGYEIWREDAGLPHAGWNSLFLCELDGETYLLRYNPYMGQGYCTYAYTLFTLGGGTETAYQTNTLEFDINGTKGLDAPGMVAFADEVNALLEKSTLLLSSEGGTYSFGPASADGFMEEFSWLDEDPNLESLYSPGDDLQTKLEKYSKYAVSNRARMN